MTPFCPLEGRFKCYADVPSKNGLIATEVGATYLLNLTSLLNNKVTKAETKFLTQVGYLVSNQHMGTTRFEMVSYPCANPAALNPLASIDVDSTILVHVSVLQTTILPWTTSKMRPTDGCLALRASIIESTPARDENKVTLLQVIVM